MGKMTVAERRARLGVRHRLAVAAADPVEVARSMVALHSTDTVTVFLSTLARCPQVTVEAVEDALYEQRSLVRFLGMRRTMFVIPDELAPAVLAACSRPVGERSRKTYLKYLADAGVGDAAFLSGAEDVAYAALAGLGEATGAQVSAAAPVLRTQFTMAEGKNYGGKQTLTPWVLILLAAEGRIVRGRPVGTWSSMQWRWSLAEKWFPAGIPDVPPEVARAELAGAWLRAFGPAPAEDLKWWTGWTVAHTKQALKAIGAVEVELDGETGFVHADDLDRTPEPDPWVALLPPLDPTPMGWTRRGWYLGEHAERLFDRNGNVGPTVWADGRIVGGWAHRADGEIVFELLEDLGRARNAEVAAAAERLATWLGPVRLAPRGRVRAPLETELLS
ncbi:winged helix DNA-binding domain-containing protein [Hamadaea tsunoensis]|uniref:winged helix DNA-binding domain-containing protein n=1 Tax=Hamadaea tsunoensis TaxID=53368 RepID=UPI00040FF188|nr:winged helix DNA-binding domain-containing protein [Hamadaea tsunoensis]